MIKKNPAQGNWEEVLEPGAKKVKKQVLIGEEESAPNFIMRIFEIEPGGATPRHSHSWEHEVYVLSGKGKVYAQGNEIEIAPGDALLIEPNEEHQFTNPYSQPLCFLCLIPRQFESGKLKNYNKYIKEEKKK